MKLIVQWVCEGTGELSTVFGTSAYEADEARGDGGDEELVVEDARAAVGVGINLHVRLSRAFSFIARPIPALLGRVLALDEAHRVGGKVGPRCLYLFEIGVRITLDNRFFPALARCASVHM